VCVGQFGLVVGECVCVGQFGCGFGGVSVYVCVWDSL